MNSTVVDKGCKDSETRPHRRWVSDEATAASRRNHWHCAGGGGGGVKRQASESQVQSPKPVPASEAAQIVQEESNFRTRGAQTWKRERESGARTPL